MSGVLRRLQKKSGENDNIRFGLWRKCVEKLGSGLRAADKRRLCTVETYPSASATTTFQPQGGGESLPINPHPRRWKVMTMAFCSIVDCKAVCYLKCGCCLLSDRLRRKELPGLVR